MCPHRLRLGLFLVFLAGFLLASVRASRIPAPKDTRIRIGLRRSLGGLGYLALTVNRPARLIESSQAGAEGNMGTRWTFRAAPGGIEVGKDDEALGVFAGTVRLEPQEDGLIEITSPRLRQSRYRGIFEISARTHLTVINELPLEEYLYGAIPAEMPVSFHPEALKAQAVVARTYALRPRHASEGYDLCDSVHCQVYAGCDAEKEKATQAVDATRGEVALYEGRPIYAVYSAACGGYTQSSEDGSAGKAAWPYLQAVPDRDGDGPDFCSGSRSYSWMKTISSAELQRLLDRSALTRAGQLEEIRFLDYDISGRVKTVEVIGSQEVKWIAGTRLRQILGEQRLPSTLVTLTRLPTGDYQFNGHGFGHGIGFCQHGANGMASSPKGYTYKDILRHYYRGVEIGGYPGGTALPSNPLSQLKGEGEYLPPNDAPYSFADSAF